MASPSGIRAGQAFVELFADDSRLVRGLKAASKRLKAWGQSVTAAGQKMLTGGMAAMGGLLGATKVFAGMGDTMAKASQRTGIGVERLSELAYAAEQSGADLTTLEAGLRRMQRTIAEAANGSESAQEALRGLGISVNQLAGLSPDEQFTLLADRLSRISDPAQRANAAMEVFGKSGTQLLPMMAEGAAGIEALSERARQLGLVMSTEDAEAAVTFGDLVSDLWKTLKMGAFVIGSALAPVLSDLVQRALGVIKSIADWIRENKAVVVTVFKVAAAVVAGGAALIVLGSILSTLGSAFGVLASIATGVGTAMSVIGTVLGAILSPVGLVIAAVAALGGYLLYVSGAGQQALSWLGQQFAALRDTALAAWKGISDALAAGDIGLAAKIVWLTLKMEWRKGIAWLSEKWEAFRGFFVSIASKMSYEAARFTVAPWQWVKKAWVQVVSFLSEAWLVFTNMVSDTWGGVVSWLKKQAIAIAGLFDESIEVEAEQRRIDEERAREKQANQQAMLEHFQRIDAERQAKLNAIHDELSAEQKAKLAALDAAEREEEERRRKAREADIKAAEDAIAQARKEWQDALDEAARKRLEAETTAPKTARAAQAGTAEFDFDGVARRTISIVGTFNPLAAAGLATGGPLERAARAGEETAKNTRKLVQEAQHGGLVFA